MSKLSKEQLLKLKASNKRYRQEHLNKDKKFFSIRISRDEGNEIKDFIKETGIPIKKLIEMGTEIMWGEINDKN